MTARPRSRAAQKLDASLTPEVVAQFAIMQPVKAAPYTTHAQFSPPDTILALPAPAPGLVLVETMYHYARAIAFAQKKDFASAQKEIDALAAIEKRRRLQAVRRVGHPGEGNRADGAPGGQRPDGRREG